MDNTVDEIKRKIRIRKFAMDNLGNDGIHDKDESIENNMYQQLYKNIEAADNAKIQDGRFKIDSNRKFRKVIIFVKRTARKIINIFFGWYIAPVMDKQTNYNGRIVNAVNLLRVMTIEQERYYKQKIAELENKIVCLADILKDYKLVNEKTNDAERKLDYVFKRLRIYHDVELLQKTNYDYFKFENQFRGPRENVKEIQKAYVPYYVMDHGGKVLDIGCGRGEFLELMWENGIDSYGIDIYEPFVDFCRGRGFDAVLCDALTHLCSLEDCSLSGIFMAHVVEHLSKDYIESLIAVAYKKLRPGCCFILESPNPECLAAMTEFFVDMDHEKPVHYKALEFLFKEVGFSSVEEYHAEQTLYPLKANHLKVTALDSQDEFNKGVDNVNKLLFGYRDYTLIAKK